MGSIKEMTVYLVDVGTAYEGGQIEGVFSTAEKALKYAETYMKEDPMDYLGVWKKDTTEGEDSWTNACYYLVIRRFQVDE
jgi:hypothetical protein